MSECCEKHKKEYEMFCFDCKSQAEPMCSICMVEHNQQHHAKGNTHISTLVKAGMVKVEAGMKQTEKHQEEIKVHDIRVEGMMKISEEVKAKLDMKIAAIKEHWMKQYERAGANHTNVLECHEKVVKEIRSCEHRIKENLNDPKRTEKKVAKLLKNHKYWQAYKVVNRALSEDVQLNDKDIKDKFVLYEKLLNEHKQQLVTLEAATIDPAEHQRLIDANKDLAKKNEKMQGRVLIFLSHHRRIKFSERKIKAVRRPMQRSPKSSSPTRK